MLSDPVEIHLTETVLRDAIHQVGVGSDAIGGLFGQILGVFFLAFVFEFDLLLFSFLIIPESPFGDVELSRVLLAEASRDDDVLHGP